MSLGLTQLLIIAFVAVLLFGSGKVSALMTDVARGIKSFKRGLAEDEREMDGNCSSLSKGDEAYDSVSDGDVKSG